MKKTIAKFSDYIQKRYEDDQPLSVSRICLPFCDVMADGEKTLEVSPLEYSYLSFYFQSELPWNWSGKSIWGIKLIIK